MKFIYYLDFLIMLIFIENYIFYSFSRPNKNDFEGIEQGTVGMRITKLIFSGLTVLIDKKIESQWSKLGFFSLAQTICQNLPDLYRY